MYVFTRSGDSYVQTAKLTASDGAQDDFLGESVAIDGDTIVAGAFLDDVGANQDQGSASIFFPATPSADLAIDKTDSPDPVAVGDDITYSLSVSNGGPSDATDVTATDTLPAGVSFKSASANCTNASGTVTCDFGALANGATETAQIVVTANEEGTVSNSATVDGAEGDPVSANDSDTATTTVAAPPPPPSADLSLDLTAPDSVVDGQRFSYSGASAPAARSRAGSPSRRPTQGRSTPGYGPKRDRRPPDGEHSDREPATVRPRPSQGPRCTIVGSSSNDVIVGTSGDDVICAGGGNDIVRGAGATT